MATASFRLAIAASLAVALASLSTSPAGAVPVALQNATATFSQGYGGMIAATIDGNLGVNNGWAIFGNPGAGDTAPQTAVFESVQNVANPSIYTFRILQRDQAQHQIGRFRLSLTTDDRSLFADSLATGGDVTANWIVLTPALVTTTGGETVSILGDNSILLGGTNPANSDYTITAVSGLTGVTGFRLEVLADASLPTSGPGRFPSNGNFILTEFQVDALTIPEPSTLALLSLGAVGLATKARRRCTAS